MTDGEAGDDWESMLDTGKLDESLNKLKVAEKSTTKTQQQTPFPGPIRILTNNTRAQYGGATEPKLKILKRPEQPQHLQQSETPIVKSSPKTLEQREQEYAEARERILGKDPFPDTIKPNHGGQQKQQNGGRNKAADGGKRSKNSYETLPPPPPLLPHQGGGGDKHHFNPRR